MASQGASGGIPKRLFTETQATRFCRGLLAASVGILPAFATFSADGALFSAVVVSTDDRRDGQRVGFGNESASTDARHVADWIVHAKDNRQLPFVIVDKTEGKVFVFYADGRLRGAAPALLGLAVGDEAVPGIGHRKLSNILPEERTTPAGRFEAFLGHNLRGDKILWVDYDTAISLHPVMTENPKERRAERLATLTPSDNRISFGCINVPMDFFRNVVRPTFQQSYGIVYVLPETRSPKQEFDSYDVREPEPQFVMTK